MNREAGFIERRQREDKEAREQLSEETIRVRNNDDGFVGDAGGISAGMMHAAHPPAWPVRGGSGPRASPSGTLPGIRASAAGLQKGLPL